MKHLLILCLLICLSFSGYSQLVASIKTENGVFNSWVDYTLHSFTYDTNGKLITKLEQDWNYPLPGWNNYLRTNYTYNPDGTVQQHILEGWFGNQAGWVNGQRYTPTYNSAGKVQSYTVELGDSISFENYLLVEKTYDINGYLINYSYKYWNPTLSIYENSSFVTMTNYPNGLVQVIEYLDWQPSTQTWFAQTREHFTYNTAGQLLTYYTESFKNGTWINGIKMIQTYDANGVQIDKLYQSWANNNWVTNWDFDYIYNSNGTLNQLVSQVLSSAGWVNGERETYTYTTQIVTARPEALSTAMALFPNPSADRLFVELPGSGVTQLTVVDLQGRTISTQPAFGKVSTLDISELSAGTYLLKADSATGSTTSKFTKQ